MRPVRILWLFIFLIYGIDLLSGPDDFRDLKANENGARKQPMTGTRRSTLEIVRLISSENLSFLQWEIDSFTDVDAAVNLSQRLHEMRLEGFHSKLQKVPANFI